MENSGDVMSSIESLRKTHEQKREEIRKRLDEFKEVLSKGDDRIFEELAFCLCTPQSRATVCWSAVESLAKNNLLFSGDVSQIKPFLNAVRFNENKSRYIVEARGKFTQIKDILANSSDAIEMREWLLENIKGLGMKECGHFLRNIGLGDSLAILDVHVLNKLKEYGVIDELPKSMTKKKYLEIEEKMKEFSKKVGIPMDELDLLFWSERTGFIFK